MNKYVNVEVFVVIGVLYRKWGEVVVVIVKFCVMVLDIEVEYRMVFRDWCAKLEFACFKILKCFVFMEDL